MYPSKGVMSATWEVEGGAKLHEKGSYQCSTGSVPSSTCPLVISLQ